MRNNMNMVSNLILALACVVATCCNDNNGLTKSEESPASTQNAKENAPSPQEETASLPKQAAPTSAQSAPASPVNAAPVRSAPNEGGHCEVICNRSKELNCKISQEICKEACVEMQNVPVCQAQMEAVMGCVTREPKEHWECSEADIAAIKDEYCQKEQTQFLKCFAAYSN